MRELFVYYRVREDATTSARRAVDAVHEALRRRYPSLVARLLTRRDDAGVTTWMETYALPPAGIDAAIESTIVDMALCLSPFIDGPRHVEVFDAER
jgi:hypothetical protein